MTTDDDDHRDSDDQIQQPLTGAFSSRNPFADNAAFIAPSADTDPDSVYQLEDDPYARDLPYDQHQLQQSVPPAVSDPFVDPGTASLNARASTTIAPSPGYIPDEDLNSYQPYYEDPFDDSAAAESSYEDSSYVADISRHRSKKVPAPGIYDRMKRRMGLGPQYSDMDLPLTEAGAAPGTIDGRPLRSQQLQPTTTAATATPSKYDDAAGAGDFDIRRIFNKILRRSPVDPSTLGPRIIHLNDAPANKINGYLDNHISTTKYNIATFLPKFLFEQFSKYSNLFFLFTCIIQQVPDVSPTNRWTTIITLGIVLFVSAVKEGIEDVKRRNADKDLNNAPVLVLSNGIFENRRWVNVAVGDIVRVESEESIPADLVLLASSEPEGLCYIETANLDGETNLKIKQGLPETADRVSPTDLSNMKGTLRSEQPNSSLYTYEGVLTLETPNGEKEIPLNPDQLLLRGATLRNTPWIHGAVVFTGHETKLMRNATAAPIKRTAVEHMVNLQIIFLFGILITLSIVSSIGDVVKEHVAASELSYLYIEGRNLVKLFFQDFLTYWILYSNLVPISMFVTIEVVKFYQAFLISSDLDMYYKPSDTPAICRTSSLVEELGQIEYIFSDKTGTLTRNIMEFKQCSIAGICYGDDIPEDKRAVEVDGQVIGVHNFSVLNENLDTHPTREVIHEFLTLLSTCHTVIPEVTADEKIKYQAASPDEGALVDGAAKLGYQFTTRRPKSITVSIRGQDSEYELLNICEFNSTRKRMSAIFRCPDGRIRLYCKGADTVILERLSPGNPYAEATLQHLEEYAADGLRTLCLAMRAISDSEYAEWSAIYDRAATTMNDRSTELDKAAELIEKDLFLLGATAIEDKLQDGVPDTIHTLQTAGIKIWVLTGDRQETAVNIGMSCKLLSEDMSLLIVNEETKEDTRSNIKNKLSAIRGQNAEDVILDTLALIIDGHSLAFALEKDLEKDFLDLAVMCKAVICCRVSPLQKALVVKLVKRHLKAILLAIGDGANDVSMIQAAHVGVGISGMEGMQAARSADVSIGQFKYLRKLLLVHGGWSYQRLSKVILYSFYKNIALYMTQFWYVFWNAYSGQVIYESWSITFYSVFFTVAPPFVLGVFDQFVNARLLDRYPELYQLGQKGTFFNVRTFWAWIFNGFFHSVILYIGGIYTYRDGFRESSGYVAGHWVWGTALYTACIVTVLGKAALVTNLWTKWTVLAIPGSLILWLIFFPIYGTVAPLLNFSIEYNGVLGHLYTSLSFWAMIVVVPAMCLLRDFTWKYAKRMYFPKSYHHVQEIQKYNIADYRPRMEQFQKAIRKVRQVQRMRKQRGFAFSQADEGQSRLIRAYDTTQERGRFGERKTLRRK
ncbi:phospholipid-transporting ATPase 1 [Myxozyma melibiosi]|uniref:Phospholipid-transporting ATPase n=1 Tax=Myxozyma melibiosi TaxID=54550 RepID=A0ABR1FAL9_9ASCO